MIAPFNFSMPPVYKKIYKQQYQPNLMKSKIATITLVVVIVLILLGLSLNYLMKNSQENAERQLREKNPLFHTIPEGGSCRDGEGDCLVGLTCVSSICSKP